jgi:lysosomal acid lipase/cholesteryl ester hydrolase
LRKGTTSGYVQNNCTTAIFTEFDQLGNNRGNKYSKKHTTHKSTSAAFWDFSLDDFCLYDIPDTIQYVLETTHANTLSYIGFSQGTAQAFAALGVHPYLNHKVNLFVALAPAMSPKGICLFS